jgi:hypothetical protein
MITVHLQLVEPLELVLDRVLDRDDVARRVVDLVERCVERGRLARPGRAGGEHRAVGAPEAALEELRALLRHPQLVEADQGSGLVEDPHHDALP